MKIKKKCFWSLLTLMLTAMVSLSLSSCGDSHNDEVINKIDVPVTNNIMGLC